MVEATPADRDRVVDFLRAASICAVVVGHWSIAIVWWDDGVLRITSAIGVTSWLWLATWVLQVMPIFFFVGGFSNLVSYDAARRAARPTGAFIRSRLTGSCARRSCSSRSGASIELTMHLLDVGAPTGPHAVGRARRLLRGFLPPGATLPFGPLWFLGVYLVVVALAPWLIGLHRRFRWWVPA